jgi:hypothetical protein
VRLAKRWRSGVETVPSFDKAVHTVVVQLQEAAPRDRDAIGTLATLYRQTNAITGERDAEKALVYVTALHELQPAPGFEKARSSLIAELSAGLTPERSSVRARRAQAGPSMRLHGVNHAQAHHCNRRCGDHDGARRHRSARAGCLRQGRRCHIHGREGLQDVD